MKCKYCGSKRVIKKGLRKNLTGKVQKWFCKDCKRYFTRRKLPRFRHKISEVSLALEIYTRFGISFRNLSYLLKKFGISISPSGLWKWVKNFSSKAKKFLARFKAKTVNIDETCIKNIAKSKSWLSVAVDTVSRFIFDFLLIFRRKPSKEFIKQFEEIRTDGFRAYPKLAKKLGIKRVKLGFGQNQIVERLFRTIKQRVYWLTKFKSLENARNFLALWISFYNFVREHLGTRKVPCEVLGMRRLSSRELVIKIFLFLVLWSVLVIER